MNMYRPGGITISLSLKKRGHVEHAHVVRCAFLGGHVTRCWCYCYYGVLLLLWCVTPAQVPPHNNGAKGRQYEALQDIWQPCRLEPRELTREGKADA